VVAPAGPPRAATVEPEATTGFESVPAPEATSEATSEQD
jgi:hypothetical protein